MPRLTVCLIALFLCINSFSQQTSIKGVLTDTVSEASLQNTVISLLRKSDSVLVKFTRSNGAGDFLIEKIPPGNFLMLVTHPYFGDYLEELTMKPGEPLDLGKVYMTPKSKLLAEVIIKSGSPIRIKGDTTVYTADSFQVRAGANVEELLRRLPGIQVDKDGQIIAMGEKVKKVLVDGEEFFGDDPGIATKNIRADIVKEVEVFDKKSDQADFTGIEDGVRDKTINLKLKDDKKKGYFGKIEIGGGLPDYYNNSIMVNSFKAKRKVAAYGIMSNTGKTNLDFRDAQNYGGSEGFESSITDDGGMMIMYSNENDFYGGRNGIPRNWNGGIHFSDKFNEGKQSLNSGYKFTKVNAPGGSRTYSNTFLPDTSWINNNINAMYSSRIQHALNLTVETTLDSNNSIKWTSRGNTNNTINQNDYYSEALNTNGKFINNNTRTNNNKADNKAFNTALLWRHKFKKASRTLSINTDFKISDSKNNGQLYSLSNFYDQGNFFDSDTIDQQNIRNNSSKSLGSKIAYTEPLSKEAFMEISYAINYYNNDNDRISNIISSTGKYDKTIDSLSNSFTFNRFVHSPGLNLKWNKKKVNLSMGTTVGINRFIQHNNTDKETYTYNFTNVFPQASINYKPKPNASLRFNYNGSGTAPSLEQLQPIRDNLDPLNQYIGNPDLKQSFQHRFSTSYNNYNVLKQKGIYTSLNFSVWQNAFTQSSIVDNVGRRTYKTVNTDGNYNLNLYSGYNFTIPDTKWQLGFGPTANLSQTSDFINNQKNINNNKRLGFEINISQYIKDKYNFNIQPNIGYVKSSSSINKSANADFWQLGGWISGNVNLPAKFEINTNANFVWRQKDPRFTANNNFINWNASVVKRMMKDKLDVKFNVYDILNQNRGYQQNFNSYSFSETYYETLQRFWTISLVWNFSNNGKPLDF